MRHTLSPVDESAAAVATKYVYDFAEGSAGERELLGGKGANLAEMTRVLGPDRVPAGFTITTEACVAYMQAGAEPPGLDEQVDEAAHAFMVEALGRPLAEAPRGTPPRALRQAERAILETVEHHAHLRLRPALSG